MTDQQENFDQIDSSELFEAAISDPPVQEIEQMEQPRDEQGRFASKDPEPEAESPPAEEPGTKDDAPPSWRLREMREERDAERTRAESALRELAGLKARFEAFERQSHQNAPKPEPVDIFADPNAYMAQQLTPFEQRLNQLSTNTTLQLSRVMNYVTHGKDTVAAAEKAVEEAMNAGDPELPGLRAKMLASDDPVGIAVDWHKSRSLVKETGGDLAAYRQRILDEALKDPAFQARVIEATRGQVSGQPAPKNIVKLPPSLNKVAASASNDAADNDVSDAALFRHALR